MDNINKDDELNIDPRETDFNDDYDMEKMANFFELEKQLAGLGFDDPILLANLRQRLLTTEDPMFTVNYKELIDGHEFRAWFELEQRGTASFTLAHYEAMLSVGPDDLHRLFTTDIDRNDAIAVLYQDQKRLLPDEETLRPMTRSQVDTCLQQLGSPEQAISRFKAAGFYHWDDPKPCATLAMPHGPFYQADEYNVDGRRLLTELKLGGNNHHLTFKALIVHLLPAGCTQEIDDKLFLPFSDLVPEHTISRSYGRLEPLNTIYEQLKKEEPVNLSINFYELKTQLADLGFSEPDVVNQLRNFIIDGERGLPDIELTKPIGDDQAYFTLFFGRGTQGQYELTCIDCSMDNLTKPGCQHMQYFQPDVSAADAIALLQLDQLQPKETRDVFRPLNQQETQAYIHLLKLNIMNTENLSYLHKQLLNLGFGDKLNDELTQKIKSKEEAFTLGTTQEYNKQNVDYTLHYKAGDKDEMYFFNKYDASMNDTQQTFYLNKGQGITAKEAYNLMDGRAVHKELENLEGQKYKAWLILDKEQPKTENGNFKLRPFTEGWNYRPERAIDKMDIVGINDEGARDKLMKSLEKGNRHQVSAMKDGKEVKLYLEANPADHRVNLTNWKGEAQQLEHYKKPEAKQDQKKDQKQDQSQEQSKKKSKGKKMTV